MDLTHYFYLYPAYGSAILGWILFSKVINRYHFNSHETKLLKKPWLEFIFSLFAAVCTIAIGQLYIHNLLLPKTTDYLLVVEALNQILIFSPFLILLLVRKQPFTTALIPKKGKLLSIIIGFVLALLALLTFLTLKGNTSISSEILEIYSIKNFPELVQVFAEDFAISICLYRLVQWVGIKKAIIIVSMLFAAGHIPAMISNGVAFTNLASLLLDAFLGVLVLHTLYKSRNFLWFWMVHFAMDMTQFIN